MSAVHSAPFSIKTWNNLAKEYGVRGEYRKAIEACNTGLKIIPDDISVLKNRAYFYIAMKKYPEAEKDLRKIILHDNTDPEMYKLLGGIEVKKGNFSEAIRLWRISIRLNPEQPDLKQAILNAKKDMRLKNSK
jgi:tetratricopeptide (TPR) repeat protein